MDDTPALSEDAGTSQNTDRNVTALFVDQEWITVEEAVLLFRALELPRSPEAIRGYCRDSKLEATTTQGLKGEQHVIKRESAEVYIADRKKVVAAMTRNIPEGDGISRKLTVKSVTSRQDPEEDGTSRDEPSGDLAEKEVEIAKLRDEVMSLKIDKQARDQIVIIMRDEREALAKEAHDASHRVGELEATLRIAAPKEWERLAGHDRTVRASLSAGRNQDPNEGDRPPSANRGSAV